MTLSEERGMELNILQIGLRMYKKSFVRDKTAWEHGVQ